MSTFPALKPISINYDLGYLNISEVATVGGGPIRFKHSSNVNGYSVSLVYTNLTKEQLLLIRNHFNENSGTHGYFDAPIDIWGGTTIVAADAVYRYLERPAETHKIVYFDITVKLRIIDGNSILYILAGNTATQPAVAAFASLAFNGNAPFILNAGGSNPTLHLKGGGASL